MKTHAERARLYRLRKKGLAPPPDYVVRGRTMTPLERNRKYKYGITPEEFDDMLKKQGNVCAICKKTANNKSWHVDHNHKNGKTRGILCHHCNILLGFIEENNDKLKNITSYIEKYK